MNSIASENVVCHEKHFLTFHFISSPDSGHLCLLSTTQLSWDNEQVNKCLKCVCMSSHCDINVCRGISLSSGGLSDQTTNCPFAHLSLSVSKITLERGDIMDT